MLVDAALIKQTVIDLRGISDLERRVEQIVRCALHAPDNPEVLALADAEIARAFPSEKALKRRWAHTKLHPVAKVEPAPTPSSEADTAVQADGLPPGAWVDPNLTRMLIALRGWGQALVYTAAQEITRSTDGSGRVHQQQVIDALLSAGVETTAKNIHDRWIMGGNGVLWRCDKPSKTLYLFAPVRMVNGKKHGRLDVVQMARTAGREELVDEGNLPGSRMIYVPYRATQKAWCGEVLKAWHSARRDPRANIRREVLQRLFDVSKPTLIGWEKAAGIKAERTFAQCVYDDEHLTPERARRAEPYLSASQNENGAPVVHWRFQWSNRYAVEEPMTERCHSRAPRERRRAARLSLEAVAVNKPNTIEREASAGSPAAAVGQIPFTKINFFDRRASKRHVSAHEQVRAMVKKTQDYSHPYAADIGRDRFGNHIVEFTYGTQQTRIDDRQPRRQADPWFAAHGGRGVIRLEAAGGYAA